MRAWMMAIALAAAATAFAEAPAVAAPKQNEVTNVSAQRAQTRRPRARIEVRRRSYLDGGTEVLPGERKYTDYVFPPNYAPMRVLGPGQDFYSRNYPLPSPWDLPGFGPAF